MKQKMSSMLSNSSLSKLLNTINSSPHEKDDAKEHEHNKQ